MRLELQQARTFGALVATTRLQRNVVQEQESSSSSSSSDEESGVRGHNREEQIIHSRDSCYEGTWLFTVSASIV